MIEPENAWDLVVSSTRRLPVSQQQLLKSVGCVLASDILADRDMPPADRAAMDGFAVRTEDLASTPIDLSVCGEVAAGSDASPEVKPGTCARIFTGANVPPGANTVVMVEDTEIRGQESGVRSQRPAFTTKANVTFLKPVAKGKNIFFKSENASKGELLVQAGTCLRAAHIGICAAVGCEAVNIHRRPRISILSTGEELLDIGAAVLPHQLRNSNGPMLVSALASNDFDVVICKTVADDMRLIEESIGQALDSSDVVLLTGGVSVGKYDLVPDAVAKVGGTVHFHGVAMKPGRPILFATSANGRCIFGLPGNPLSSMTAFYEFVLPAVRRLAGVPPENCRPHLRLKLAEDLSTKGGPFRRHVLGRVLWDNDGPRAITVESHGTADLVAGGRADGTIMVPPSTKDIRAGLVIDFRPWHPDLFDISSQERRCS